MKSLPDNKVKLKSNIKMDKIIVKKTERHESSIEPKAKKRIKIESDTEFSSSSRIPVLEYKNQKYFLPDNNTFVSKGRHNKNKMNRPSSSIESNNKSGKKTKFELINKQPINKNLKHNNYDAKRKDNSQIAKPNPKNSKPIKKKNDSKYLENSHLLNKIKKKQRNRPSLKNYKIPKKHENTNTSTISNLIHPINENVEKSKHPQKAPTTIIPSILLNDSKNNQSPLKIKSETKYSSDTFINPITPSKVQAEIDKKKLNNCSEDIKKEAISSFLDVSGNIISLEGCSSSSDILCENLKFPKHYIVVDTNVLLDEKNTLYYAKGKVLNSRLVSFYIPYVVLQELDNLKNGSELKYKAQKTIKWINSLLNEKDSFVEGQSFESHLEAYSIHKLEEADDVILNCSIQLKKERGIAELLTKDVNLCNKAIVSGIALFDVSNYKKEFKPGNQKKSHKSPNQIVEEKECNNESHLYKSQLSCSDDEMCWSPHKPTKSNNLTGKKCQTIEIQFCQSSDIAFEPLSLPNIEKSIKQLLGNLLEVVMIDSFGDLWKKIVLYKPPWTALQILFCIQKHWIAAFMDKFNQNLLDIIEFLIKTLKSKLSKENLEKVAKMLRFLPSLINDYMKLARNAAVLQTAAKEHFESNASNVISASDNQHADCNQNYQHSNSMFSVIINAVNAVGNNATAIKSFFFQVRDVDSLSALRIFLVDFGNSLKSIADNPNLSVENSILDHISYYKSNASKTEFPHFEPWPRILETRFSSTSEGHSFIYNYLSNLEQLIREIDSFQ